MSSEVVYVDEDCLLDHTERELAKSSIEALTEILLELDRNDTPVHIAKPYFEIVLGYNQLPLYEVLFNTPCPLDISQELLRQLTILLERCNELNNIDDVETQLMVQEAEFGVRSHVYSAALARHEAEREYAAIVRRVGGAVSGTALILQAERRAPCFVLCSPSDLISFYRQTIYELQPRGGAFLPAATKAFPKLKFHNSVSLEALDVDLNIHMKTVLIHLSFLNDEFHNVGATCGWDLPRMQAIAATKGIDFSDESSNTKRDVKKMEFRKRDFGTGEASYVICCSYHTKISPTQGRIHFFPSHPRFPNVTLVGIFHRHLPI